MSAESRHPVVVYLTERFRITILFVIFAFVWGAVSYLSMPRESDPEVIIPFALVTTIFPGASPLDVEELITNKIESGIESVERVKTITSTSKLGSSSIFVEFEVEANLDDSIQKLRDAVEQAKPNLPDDALDPQVIEIQVSDEPVLTLSVSGDVPEKELQAWAERISDEIKTIPDVLKVSVSGKRDTLWEVRIDPDKLNSQGISFSQLFAALGANNVHLPSGTITVDDRLYHVRVTGQFKDIHDLERLPIAQKGDAFIYLADVALVQEQLSKKETLSFISVEKGRIKPTISLQVIKRSGGNIIRVGDSVRKHLNELKQSGIIPESVNITTTFEMAEFIRDDLSALQDNAFQTFFLILLVLFLALNIRGAIVASMVIPLSFLITFGVLHAFGITLNGMTLFALVLALGLLVDTAIVITEGMYEALREGKEGVQAAFHSLDLFQWSVISGVGTTIAAFVPMLLVSGITGQYLRTIPITVSVLLSSSLFLSLTVLPALGAKYFKLDRSANASGKENIFARLRKERDRALASIQNAYQKIMGSILRNKAKRRLVLAVSWVAFFMVLAFPFVGVLETSFFPRVDINFIIINIKAPQGTTLEETQEITEEVEKIISEIPEVKNFTTTVGAGTSFGFGESGGSGEHLASMMINLIDAKERKRKSFDIIDDLRPKVKAITKAEVVIEDIAAGPPQGAPVEVRITGANLKTLEALTLEVSGALKDIPGTVDVDTSLDQGLPEFVFQLKRDIISYYGLSAFDVARYLRALISGASATTVAIDGEDIDVVITADDRYAHDIDTIKNITILSLRGPVTLGALADISISPSLSSISHKDGKRMVRVTSFITKQTTTASVFKELQKRMKGIQLESGYQIAYGGETEDIHQSFTDLYISMSVAVFLIFLILAIQFNSFRQTAVVFFSLPLALIGVFLGLSILRLPLNFPAFIGVVSLTGIAVNDAIILVSQINKNLFNKGNPSLGLKTADFVTDIVAAGASRIQPIFLTSITTILGLLPVTFSNEVWTSLGFAIICGLIFSTFLTLIVIPIMYVSLQKKRLGAR